VSHIAVSVVLAASPETVWNIIEPVERHVDWMADAEAITFDSEQTRGVGTRFTCLTKVGPIRLRDHMEITEWEPGRCMGVQHRGLVVGSGRFTLTAQGNDTLFAWEEDLTFPWWLGGQLGSAIGGKLVLSSIWKRNLRRLAMLVTRAARRSGPEP
jgi:hypothetical protein